MNIEEYKKELAEWKKNHIDFYNEYVHAIKSRKATLTTYMHVYVFAMNQIPGLPKDIELGDCDDLFMKRVSTNFFVELSEIALYQD